MASETSLRPPLHFVLFPFMSPGHIIPMVDLSRLLAQRGVTMTIVMTPHNAGRFKNVLSRAVQSGLPINLVEIKLPEGHESLDMLDSMGTSLSFFQANNMLEEPVEKLLKEIQPRPSCIIVDRYLPYTNRVAKNLGIPKIIFNGEGCFYLLCMHIMSQNYELLETIKSEKEYFPLPNFPDKIEFTKSHIPMTLATGDWKEYIDATIEADNSSYGVIINTFEELETAYIRDYKKAKAGKVWSIGPVSLCNKVEEDEAERGNKAGIDKDECIKWLDSKEDGSVLYVCLGSICNLPPSQLKEIGLGLEESQRPFIWVIRGWEKNKELVEWISESGFKERIKERSLLIMGWSPQMLILSHPAIGGFLTHCGWNSTLEGITSGIPLLTWPLFADQFCNEKLVVQILKAGVSAGVEDPMTWGLEEKIGVLVDNEGVKKAVEELMGDSNDAKERRKRVKELGELAHKAVEEGGSSHSNITSFLQDIMQLLAQSKTDQEPKNEREAAGKINMAETVEATTKVMAKSSLLGEVEVEVEIKAPAAKFYHMYAGRPHHVAKATPRNVQACDLHEGEWGTVGSIVYWNYVHEGQAKVAKEIIELVEPEKKLIKFRVIEGDVMAEYKSFLITIQVTPKEGGVGSVVKWHIEYEKIDENVAHPENLLPFFAEMTKEIDDHLLSEE